MLDRSGFHKEAFEQIASIDLKKEEKWNPVIVTGLADSFCDLYRRRIKTGAWRIYSLTFCKKDHRVWTMSVREVQSLASGNGRLPQKKQENGVTTAVAAREWRIHFE